MRMTKYASVFISLFLAALYGLGTVSHLGFLEEMGVTDNRFSLSLYDTFFHGFFFLAKFGTKGFVVLFFVGLVIFLIAVFGLVFEKWAEGLLLHFSRTFVLPRGKRVYRIFNFSAKWFLAGLAAFFCYAILLLSLAEGVEHGERNARHLKFQVANGEKVMKTIRMKNRSGALSMYPVVCNDSQCLYYDGEKTIIINNSDINSITSASL